MSILKTVNKHFMMQIVNNFGSIRSGVDLAFENLLSSMFGAEFIQEFR